MLRELEVRNLGIIETVRLELPSGFVVLTGETGAGKSLLVHSLKLLSGERGDTDMLRAGAEKLVVEGVFSPVPEGLTETLEELGVEGDTEVVIRREMTATGRSRAWVNDVQVTLVTLQKIAPWLLAIAGQHEQRDLADPTTHLEWVDAYGVLGEEAAQVRQAYGEWQQTRDGLVDARRKLAQRRDRLDLVNFQLNEIASARIREGEMEALVEERAFLRHAERIGELLAQARQSLGGDQAITQLARAVRTVRELAQLGIAVNELSEQLEQAQLLAEEALRGLDGLADRVRVNPHRLEEVETRLATLERLTRKYGGSEAAVLAHAAALEKEKASLEGVEEAIEELENREKRLSQEFLLLAERLFLKRQEAAARLSGEVTAVLARLGMPGTRMELRQTLRIAPDGLLAFQGQKVHPAPWGVADGEIYLSPNPGEPLKPLAKIASGGELSRIHLALRTVLRRVSRQDPNLTLLFDEVDSGIGGRVAQEVGQLLRSLGAQDQVLVVTHVPQVAGLGDAHFVVTKKTRQGRTVTEVSRVEGEARVEELVRMLGAKQGSEAARQHALELLRCS